MTSPKIEESKVRYFVELMKSLGPYDRMRVLDGLRENFCMHCGDDDPRCQCWNDE